MAEQKVEPAPTKPKRRRARSREKREDQMIAKAIDLAEKQLEEGTASSQVIVHYLKLGTTKALLEKEKLERENELLRAKTENLESARRTEALYQEAIDALRLYNGMEETVVEGD